MPKLNYTDFSLCPGSWRRVIERLETARGKSPDERAQGRDALRRRIGGHLSEVVSHMEGLFIDANPHPNESGESDTEAASDYFYECLRASESYSLPVPAGYAAVIRAVADAKNLHISEGESTDGLIVCWSQLADLAQADFAGESEADAKAEAEACADLADRYRVRALLRIGERRVSNNADAGATNSARRGNALRERLGFEYKPAFDRHIGDLDEWWRQFADNKTARDMWKVVRATRASLPSAAVEFVAAEWLSTREGGKYTAKALAAIRPFIVDFYVDGARWIYAGTDTCPDGTGARELIVAALRQFSQEMRERTEAYAAQAKAEREASASAPRSL